jgi:hypothetical protein
MPDLLTWRQIWCSSTMHCLGGWGVWDPPGWIYWPYVRSDTQAPCSALMPDTHLVGSTDLMSDLMLKHHAVLRCLRLTWLDLLTWRHIWCPSTIQCWGAWDSPCWIYWPSSERTPKHPAVLWRPWLTWFDPLTWRQIWCPSILQCSGSWDSPGWIYWPDVRYDAQAPCSALVSETHLVRSIDMTSDLMPQHKELMRCLRLTWQNPLA